MSYQGSTGLADGDQRRHRITVAGQCRNPTGLRPWARWDPSRSGITGTTTSSVNRWGVAASGDGSVHDRDVPGSFTFGHVRQLDAALAWAWHLGAGPDSGEPVVVDWDSTICEVHGNGKQGAADGYAKKLGYHPLLATLVATSEIVMCRMHTGSANTARGVCVACGCKP